MLIAHLPAGYLLTAAVVKGPLGWPLLLAALAGSLAPDLDVLYFYAIDHQRHLHHTYWTHTPIFWIGLGLVTLALSWRLWPRAWPLGAVFFGNVLLHLLLDTLTSTGIRWLYPFSDHLFFWFPVPDQGYFWIANFALHWTFLIEVAIGIAALALYLHRRRRFAPRAATAT